MTDKSARAGDTRFAFGSNWRCFVDTLDEQQIDQAVQSLRAILGDQDLFGRRMLDAGCGSGLSSLAARRLGVRVHAFDFDADSVTSSHELKSRFAGHDSEWIIERGDVLDEQFMNSLGTFDLVYSWGVLHHTGDMKRALENVINCVSPGGRLFIAIYNDQDGASRRWASVKRIYQSLPDWARPLLVAACIPKAWGKTFLRDALRANPLATWRDYSRTRGMSPWRDMVDWVGGYPFEVAKPEVVFDFYRARGFTLERLKTVGGGFGCNEFVFRRF